MRLQKDDHFALGTRREQRVDRFEFHQYHHLAPTERVVDLACEPIAFPLPPQPPRS